MEDYSAVVCKAVVDHISIRYGSAGSARCLRRWVETEPGLMHRISRKWLADHSRWVEFRHAPKRQQAAEDSERRRRAVYARYALLEEWEFVDSKRPGKARSWFAPI